MLKIIQVSTRLPAKDLNRARTWYAEKLGLRPFEERDGGLHYVCAQGDFCLFLSAGESNGEFTQITFSVADIKQAVAELKKNGVVFSEYSYTHDAVARVDDNYPSKGIAEYGAWFRDSEGNMLSLSQSVKG